jgi:hypothetical protein
MAVTAFWYGLAFRALANKEIDLDDGNVKVALCTNAYTPDQDAHDYFDDITGEVAAGGGYTAGGETLGTPAVAYDGPSNTLSFDGDDVVWAASTITARYAVVYYNTGVAGTSPLLCYVDFGADFSSSGGNFTIQWHANGIARIVVS